MENDQRLFFNFLVLNTIFPHGKPTGLKNMANMVHTPHNFSESILEVLSDALSAFSNSSS